MTNPFESFLTLPAEQLVNILGVTGRCLNLVVAGFGAAMMFSMKTETSRETPWTKRLAIALLLFTLQYLVYFLGLREITSPLFGGSNQQIWAEFFSLPINFFLLTAAEMLLNKQSLLPRWFFTLAAIDVAAVALGWLAGLDVDNSYELLPTLCRLPGDAITFMSLLSLGYASYINTRLDEAGSGVWGVIGIGFVYGGIHIISPFTPNIAYLFSPQEQDVQVVSGFINSGLVFIAALSKLVLVYIALRITSLEHQTLMDLRCILRDSLDDRNVFFSSEGVLKGILGAFKADAVKLYVRVPPVRETTEDSLVHVYSRPAKTDEPYEIEWESATRIPVLLKSLTRAQEGAGRPEEARTGGGLWSRILQTTRRRKQPTPHIVIEPIRYHGALIGYLEVEKKGEFTYSAETLCRILSEDISVLTQFYRVQESLRILVEGFHNNLEMRPKRDAATVFSIDLKKRFEEVIQEVLSPLRTRFHVDTGFAVAKLPDGASGEEADARSMEIETVPYECVTDQERGNLTIGHIYLDYQPERDPVAKPSLGYFSAYRNAVGSIVTKTFLSCVEQTLNLVIRNLSLELTKTLDYDKLLKQIQTSVKEAELDGVVIYHPALRDLSEFTRKNEPPANRAVGSALAAAFPDAKQVLQQLTDSPTVIAQTVGTSDRLIIGMKLRLAAVTLNPNYAGIFVGVRRFAFAEELRFNTPWRSFLNDLAGIAGTALERIVQAKQIQRDQLQQNEDYMILSMAEKVGLIAHELLSHIENLVNNSALLTLDLPESLDEAAKEPINLRLGEMRKEFEALRSLTGLIRSSALVQGQLGPSSLQETLQSLRLLYESKTNIKIEILGIKERTAGHDSAPLRDVQVKLAKDIVELTFGNLIRNSIAAIRRKAGDAENGNGGNPCQGLIKIWAEVDAGEKIVDCFINDNGSGIPPLIRERLFEVNVSSTPGRGGLGLFYLKRKLVRNAGFINLEHSEVGDTTFRVRLPIYQ